MRKVQSCALAVVLSCLLVSPLAGQSAQRFSIQGSGLYASVYGGDYDEYGISNGIGFEGQLRFTPSALSIGAGFQYTKHSSPGGTIFFDDGSPPVGVSDWDGRLFGFFIEPRYVIPTRSVRFGPYISARLSMLKYEDDTNWQAQDGSVRGTASTSTDGLTVNGGGGVLVRLGPRVNMDLGVTYGYSNFDEYLVEFRSGSESVSDRVAAGSGSNIVVRLGFAIGLGG